MDKKYLFFDIDGTLAVGRPGDQYVPDSTREALERLREVGHFLAIATGRAQALAVDYMHELGFHSMVSDGGYGVTIDDEFLGVRPLDHNACVALVDECREKGYPWSIQVENSDTRFTPDGRFEEFTRDIYQKTRVVPGLEPRDYPEIYKVNVACYEPDERRLKTLPALPWCRYQKEYIFVEPADKAYGIRQILAREGGAPADVVVFDRPAFSSRPKTILAHCTPWPAAPLHRLSMAPVQMSVLVRALMARPTWATLVPTTLAVRGWVPAGSTWTKGRPS